MTYIHARIITLPRRFTVFFNKHNVSICRNNPLKYILSPTDLQHEPVRIRVAGEDERERLTRAAHDLATRLHGGLEARHHVRLGQCYHACLRTILLILYVLRDFDFRVSQIYKDTQIHIEYITVCTEYYTWLAQRTYITYVPVWVRVQL